MSFSKKAADLLALSVAKLKAGNEAEAGVLAFMAVQSILSASAPSDYPSLVAEAVHQVNMIVSTPSETVVEEDVFVPTPPIEVNPDNSGKRVEDKSYLDSPLYITDDDIHSIFGEEDDDNVSKLWS